MRRTKYIFIVEIETSLKPGYEDLGKAASTVKKIITELSNGLDTGLKPVPEAVAVFAL